MKLNGHPVLLMKGCKKITKEVDRKTTRQGAATQHEFQHKCA